MGKAEDRAALEAERSDVIAILRARTQAWKLAGEPPTFSVDGESYQWESWRMAKLKEIEQITQMITALDSPYLIRSRGRA